MKRKQIILNKESINNTINRIAFSILEDYHFEKQITLQILDRLWKEHLATMDHLRQGIFLRSYGGKNPRQEYKREAFAQFTGLMSSLQQEVIKILSHIQIIFLKL